MPTPPHSALNLAIPPGRPASFVVQAKDRNGENRRSGLDDVRMSVTTAPKASPQTPSPPP